jgi:hypothetical protein
MTTVKLLDPRVRRLRALYLQLDELPERLREYRKKQKELREDLRRQIDALWADLEGRSERQAPLTFPVHQGDRLIGYSAQPKVAKK